MIRLITFNNVLYKTKWYQSLFVNPDTYPDNNWYRNHEERNYEVINLGSTSAKWAFDYSETAVKAMNWAQAPQTLQEDFNLLRHFHSILRKNGYVLITIMPFTGINKQTNIFDSIKYLKIDTQGQPIEPYMYNEALWYAKYPILFGKIALKALVKYIFGSEKKNQYQHPYTLETNPMTEPQLQKDAKCWMEGWKRQFGISDLEQPLTDENWRGRQMRIQLMQEIVDFCIERSYQPIWVVPPVSSSLAKEFTPKFRQTYIYDYLNQVDRHVPLLDYSMDSSFIDKDLYFNSFFLNRKGSRLFTQRVLGDLGLQKSHNTDSSLPLPVA